MTATPSPPTQARTTARRRTALQRKEPSLATWRAGVHILGTRLWCDALRRHDVCFLSSAEVTLARRSLGRTATPTATTATLLCTETTLKLRRALSPTDPLHLLPDANVLLSPMGRPFHFGSLRLELFPSGQQPGAASLWLKLPTGQTVIYGGQPVAQTAPGAKEQSMQLRAAETLILSAPVAALGVPLPPQAEALEQLLQLILTSSADSAVTIVLCSATVAAQQLWPALQQVTTLLPDAQLLCHGEILRTLQTYRALGLLAPKVHAPQEAHEPAPLPSLYRTGRVLQAKTVLLWPAQVPLPRSQRLAGPGAARVLLCDSTALAPTMVAKTKAALPSWATLSGAIALADSLDLPGLLRYVLDSEAKQVWLTSGYSEAVAAALLTHQVAVAPLGPPRQLALFG